MLAGKGLRLLDQDVEPLVAAPDRLRLGCPASRRAGQFESVFSCAPATGRRCAQAVVGKFRPAQSEAHAASSGGALRENLFLRSGACAGDTLRLVSAGAL